MTALSANVDRKVSPAVNFGRLPLKASQVPFAGSALALETTGYAKTLATGEPFVGFAREQVLVADTPAADGDRNIEADNGWHLCVLPVTGVAIDDVRHKRLVYASDDGTFNMTGSGSLIGPVIGVDATDRAIVLAVPYSRQQTGGPFNGFVTLADAAATLNTGHLDKLLLITPSTGRTLTLPPAADCTGRTLTVKVLAAFAVTLDGNASETIDGAATFAAADAANDIVSIMSDGTNWQIISKAIA